MNSLIKKILWGDITIKINNIVECDYLRFINLCKNRNVYIWKLILNQDGVVFHTYKTNLDILNNICDKCGIQFEIGEQKGIPELNNKIRCFSSIFVGGIICIIVHYMLSLIVWDIDFSGNYIITESRMKEYLENNNIKKGMLIRKIDVNEIEKLIIKDFPEVIFVSASCDGTILKIKLKESINYEYLQEDNICMNLVSDMDGYVSSIITCKGVGVVKTGDRVKKGDILISGIIELKDDSETVVSNIGVRAEGEVIIEGTLLYEDSFEINYVEKNYTDKKSRIYPYFLDRKPLNDGDSCDIMEQKLCFNLFNTFELPQVLQLNEIYYYEEYEYFMTDAEINGKIDDMISKHIDILKSDGIMANSYDYSMYQQDNKIYFAANINVMKKAETFLPVSENELSIEQSGGVQIGN